ncbi:MAG: bifunctional metallophosphatase/5'-nucleotidase [Flavobacteriaceae bacterium]
MKLIGKKIYLLLFLCCLILSGQEKVVVFSINDMHSRIENFSKIKPLIDKEKEKGNKVFFVSAGDIFSGNPVVDNYSEKGFPIIDLLNRTGLDISVIGNHEFDYGQNVLSDRISQANFPFVCANFSGGKGELSNVKKFEVINKDGISIAFIGAVETGNFGRYPLTHPKKVKGLFFTNPIKIFEDYKIISENSDIDLVVALTHLGKSGDEKLLQNFNYIDLVIGGHSNHVYGKKYENGYMIMSGKNLEMISKTTMSVYKGEITDFRFEKIDLSNESLEKDHNLELLIQKYKDNPSLYKRIGYSSVNHTKAETGCFYTEAIREVINVDIVIQNSGGIRGNLKTGVIAPIDIYTIDPFGNGLDNFLITPSELNLFLKKYNRKYYISSKVNIKQKSSGYIEIYRNGRKIDENEKVSLAMNDYISNTFSEYLPEPLFSHQFTTAEYLIKFLNNHIGEKLNFKNCGNF